MEKVYRTIVEKLNNVIVVANAHGDVEYVSPSAKQLLGYEPKELLGEGWWANTRSGEETSVSFLEYIRGMFNQNGHSSAAEISYERQLKTAYGEDKWLLWNTSVGPDESIISIGSDITKRKKAEKELEEKHRVLQEKTEDIVDSIQYARRIQEAILPKQKILSTAFEDAFVLYLPKDVVSGDFYWYTKRGDKVFVAAVDCTGHGVPGALMSVMGNSLLKDIVEKQQLTSPEEILARLDDGVNHLMQKEEEYDSLSDGMDVSLAVIDTSEQTVEFAGAMRPLWLVRDKVLTEIKGSRYPIGYFHGVEKQFEKETIHLKKGDALYLFSDGYADQFGGEKNKKFNKKKMKELVVSIANLPGEEQKNFMEYALKNWRQDVEQTDDVLVMGVKI